MAKPGADPDPFRHGYGEATEARIKELKRRSRRRRPKSKLLLFSLFSLVLTSLIVTGYAAAAVYSDLLESEIPGYVVDFQRNMCIADAVRRTLPRELAEEGCQCVADAVRETFELGEATRLLLSYLSGMDWLRAGDDDVVFSDWIVDIGESCFSDLAG